MDYANVNQNEFIKWIETFLLWHKFRFKQWINRRMVQVRVHELSCYHAKVNENRSCMCKINEVYNHHVCNCKYSHITDAPSLDNRNFCTEWQWKLYSSEKNKKFKTIQDEKKKKTFYLQTVKVCAKFQQFTCYIQLFAHIIDGILIAVYV